MPAECQNLSRLCCKPGLTSNDVTQISVLSRCPCVPSCSRSPDVPNHSECFSHALESRLISSLRSGRLSCWVLGLVTILRRSTTMALSNPLIIACKPEGIWIAHARHPVRRCAREQSSRVRSKIRQELSWPATLHARLQMLPSQLCFPSISAAQQLHVVQHTVTVSHRVRQPDADLQERRIFAVQFHGKHTPDLAKDRSDSSCGLRHLFVSYMIAQLIIAARFITSSRGGR
jgi:hypothetical protein